MHYYSLLNCSKKYSINNWDMRGILKVNINVTFLALDDGIVRTR